jgi:NhaA family Na+:H+ antiporter
LDKGEARGALAGGHHFLHASPMQAESSASSTFNVEILGGLVLLLAALGALLFVNLGGAGLYHGLFEFPITIGVAPLVLTKNVHHWINDGLMVLFFIVVGIEIQREVRTGSLRDPRQAMVPVLAAVGGFVLPAVVYGFVAGGDPAIARGWSIPTATDIAFAVALLTMLKDYVPASLRIFLLALAVADDLLAILVIAIFYTADVVWMNLFLAGMAVLILLAKNRLGLRSLTVYVAVGIFMWLSVLKSGVHATVAGVLIGVLLPLEGKSGKASPADVIEHALQPWVRWLVLPMFAFANVGVDIRALTLQSVLSALTWGITLGLFVGKQIGVLGTVWILEHAGFRRPAGSTWWQIYGVASLCGIGFTMSLFVGALALPAEMQPEIRLGVILGSMLSASLAFVVLRRAKA